MKTAQEEVERRLQEAKEMFSMLEECRIVEASLRKAWNEISVDTLRSIVDNFSKRLKKCIDANGGHFE